MLRRGLRPSKASREGSPGLLRRGFRSGSFLAENISDTTRGVDKLGVAGVAFYLLAQVADVDVHGTLVAELVAPDPPEQRASREHPAGARRQGHQELELRVRKIHLAAVHRHPAAWQVDVQPVVDEPAGTRAARRTPPR